MSTTDLAALQARIDSLFDADDLDDAAAADVERVLDLLDTGELRVAEPTADGGWQVNEWAKKAILLSFRTRPARPHSQASR